MLRIKEFMKIPIKISKQTRNHEMLLYTITEYPSIVEFVYNTKYKDLIKVLIIISF